MPVTPAISCLKLTCTCTCTFARRGYLFLWLALAIIFWYTMSSAALSGWHCKTAAVYNAKHCSHVSKFGMTFLDWMRSAAWTTRIWPSRSWANGFTFPHAGGRSMKYTYSLALMCSHNLLAIAGRPGPAKTRDSFTDSAMLLIGSTPFSQLLSRTLL